MKILVLSWEFLLRIIGGIVCYVVELYLELVKLGYEVYLVIVKFGEVLMYEIVEGIEVYRVLVGLSYNFFYWIGNMNEVMGCYGGKLIKEEKNFDIIYVYDWLVVDVIIVFKYIFKLLLIVIIYVIENGCYNGIYNCS